MPVKHHHPFSTFDLLSNNSSSTSTNITHQQLVLKFPSFTENVSSIANSIFFLVVFTILLMAIFIFILKAKEALKRNHKILFLLVIIFILVQYFGLIFRLVYNAIGLKINSFQDLTLVGNLHDMEIAMWVCSTFEIGLVVSQIATIILIMAFIMIVFLNTMRMSGAMSKRTFNIFQKTLIIITILCEIIFIALTLTLTITDLLMKMSIDFDVTSIYIVVFVVFIAVMTFQTVMFMFLGIRLLYVVKNQSLHSKQSTSKRTPYGKIIGLIIGMVLSAFLQILAGAVSFATTLYVPYLHIIDYFLQCFGIFIFAVFVLLLYGPLMSQENMSSGTEEPIGSNPPTMQQHLSRVTTPFTPMSPEDVELELNRKIQDLKV